MNPVSAQSSAADSHAFRVSLAGTTPEPARVGVDGQSLTAALDDALQQLTDITQPSGTDTPESQSTQPELFRLIADMSAARSRRHAAAKFAEFISAAAVTCSVRCGIGKRKMTHFFDPRLGWLGPESSLFQEAVAKWDPHRRRAEDPKIDLDSEFQPLCILHPSDEGREETIEVVLPQPAHAGRCVIWIGGTQTPPELLLYLRRIVHVVGSVLWSRPALSWPTIAIRLARRTSILLAVVAITLALMAVWPVHYRVPCVAQVETTHQRLVATPFQATLLKTNVKPGDTVKAGDVLVVLDGRPLRLEREAIEAEMQQVAKEHDVALATRRIADAQQAALREQQLMRQHDLLSDRLERLEVVSPIDGVVVSGDLEKHVGSPLERGQTLIEVAPMDHMVIEVEIPEHEIGYVSRGAATRVKLDAIGGESIRLPLSEVYPSAQLRDDRNVFIGRIEIDNGEHRLRPGMRGQATTYGPLRPWIWSWVRGGIERVLWWIGY